MRSVFSEGAPRAKVTPLTHIIERKLSANFVLNLRSVEIFALILRSVALVVFYRAQQSAK